MSVSTSTTAGAGASAGSWRHAGSRRPKPNQAGSASGSAAGAGGAAAEDPALAEFEREKAEWRAAAAKGQTPSGGALTQQAVQEYAAKLEDENEAVLDRALGEAAQATEVGAATLAKLDSQEKQLRKIDSDLKDMNVTMTRSERILSGMKSWSASVWNSITGPKKAADTSFDGSGAAAKAAEKNAAAAAAADAKSAPKTAAAAAAARGIDPTPRPVRLAARAGKESRVDEQLDQLEQMIGVLGEQAKDMNRVITETGDLVDHIDTVVTTTQQRVGKATRNAQKIIDDN